MEFQFIKPPANSDKKLLAVVVNRFFAYFLAASKINVFIFLRFVSLNQTLGHLITADFLNSGLRLFTNQFLFSFKKLGLHCIYLNKNRTKITILYGLGISKI